MNVSEVKAAKMAVLEELEAELETLAARVKEQKKKLNGVKTRDDLERFENEIDLEEGLKHITLFE